MIEAALPRTKRYEADSQVLGLSAAVLVRDVPVGVFLNDLRGFRLRRCVLLAGATLQLRFELWRKIVNDNFFFTWVGVGRTTHEITNLYHINIPAHSISASSAQPGNLPFAPRRAILSQVFDSQAHNTGHRGPTNAADNQAARPTGGALAHVSTPLHDSGARAGTEKQLGPARGSGFLRRVAAWSPGGPPSDIHPMAGGETGSQIVFVMKTSSRKQLRPHYAETPSETARCTEPGHCPPEPATQMRQAMPPRLQRRVAPEAERRAFEDAVSGWWWL